MEDIAGEEIATSDQTSSTVEDIAGEEINTDDQTSSMVENIMYDVIETVRAPSLCLSFPIQQQELVKFVSDLVYQELRDNFELLIQELPDLSVD
jgi:hypothetical protein